uniref:Uncharacterized protein n=1 Tax=Trypanosoma congolense (strain IL3000) TaxID=1068625 RepID=G0UWE1_TRYCI|nr:conserved hypothetical protein [Trypanosoma congolense IL3000]
MVSAQSDSERQKLIAALHLKEQDDALLCAFGPDFFNGARVGAGCGGVFTAYLAWRSFVDLRKDHRLCDVSLPKHMHDNSWTIKRGFRSRPFFTVGCIALSITTVLKTAKFCLASYRYQEFVADDIGFELLKEMYAGSCEEQHELEVLTQALSNPNGIDKTPSVANAPPVGGNGSKGTALTELLVGRASSVCEREPPSFWDGVAVGVMGSVMDCYLPSKPLYSYYNMRCGMPL